MRKESDLIIVHVDKFDDPHEIAQIDSEKKIIYLSKRANTITLLHEVGHYVYGHQMGLPYRAKKFGFEEFQATMYSYKLIGKPKHTLGRMRAILMVLSHNYGLRYKDGLIVIRKSLLSVNAPRSWFEDYEKLVKAVKAL